VDYPAAWQRAVAAYQALADACPPGIRVSLEFKPTDESSRFAIVPSTGAALLLAQQVDRPNFGLTLDVGHMLMAGENPAHSVAMVGAAGKLFGLQLNDAHVRLGAEDGLAFGAVNPLAALELVRWMQRSNYSGHVYFDTFPLNEEPVREAEYNVRRFKALWARAARLADAGIDGFAETHDAMGVLEALEADVDSLGGSTVLSDYGGGTQQQEQQQQQQQQQDRSAIDGQSANSSACPGNGHASSTDQEQ
jgi:L-rhamnose isomerase